MKIYEKKRKTTKKKTKTITICSSAAFFRQALDTKKELKKMGYGVKIPHTANIMKRRRDFRVETYKTWFNDPKKYTRKNWLMKNHFKKVSGGDAILILNYEKNGVPGYIGGNTLMEAAIALYQNKPIFVLNHIPDDLNFKEEILGMKAVFLGGDISKIRL